MTAVHDDRPDAEVAPPVIGGIDHVEWWVGNARSFAALLVSGFGFEPVAYAGPETGRRDQVCHVLAQGDIRWAVTGALGPESPIADHVRTHGDGVRDVSFLVGDAAAAHDAAVRRGAPNAGDPATETDEHGTIHRSTIGTYGDTVHSFIDRSAYDGPFAPGFGPPRLNVPEGPPVGLTGIDHVVGNVERGRLDDWVSYYGTVLGFDQLVHFGDDQISTEYSALMSTVVWDNRKVVLPINEPADGKRTSQIEEYLDYYRSPGVQHLALRTDDIVATVGALRRRGIGFLDVPSEYYDEARQRMAGVELPWGPLEELGIMVDRDADGHLLQIFTETLCDRPTVFVEIIQREGAKGFGAGNFKALFEAIERAQADRGNL